MSRTVKQQYRKNKSMAKSCRNNGSCPYCQRNRMHKHAKRIEQFSSMLELTIKTRSEQDN